MAASDTIEAEGHLIDSGHLSAIFDKIIEHRAQYEILQFDIGRTNDDASRISMRITAVDEQTLDDLLQQLTTWGCYPVGEREDRYKAMLGATDAAELVDEGRDDAGPGGPDRVAERNGASVEIYFFRVDVEGLLCRQSYTSESLVYFKVINVPEF